MKADKTLFSILYLLLTACMVYETKTVNASVATIEVSPKFALIGEEVSVVGEGFTQIAGNEVRILFSDQLIAEKRVTTLADGSFSTTYRIPAMPPGDYIVVAIDDYGVTASTDIKTGPIAINLDKIEGPVGTEVVLTGYGFEPGLFSAVFESVNIITDGSVSNQGLIHETFIVPDVAPGVYTVTVVDSEGTEASKSFTVIPSFVIPEYPVGTVSAIVTCLAALVLVYRKPRFLALSNS